jgi:hypothetical protein
MPEAIRKARAAILRVLRESGGRKRTVLDGLAGGDRSVLNGLLAERKVIIRGQRKGAVYVHA